MSFFAIDAHWYWWTLALLLIAMQTFAAEDFFLALAITAGGMGFVVLFVPDLNLPMQALSFTGLAIFIFFIARFLIQDLAAGSDHPNLNQPGARYIGRIITLTHPIVDGSGNESLEGVPWTLKGPDCEAGSKVEVVALEGIALQVQPVE